MRPLKQISVLFLIGAVLILMGAMITGGGHTLLEAAESNAARAAFEIKCPLPAVPDAMTIYQTLTPTVSHENVQALMKTFMIKGKIIKRDNQWQVRDGMKELEIFTQPGTGYMRFSNRAQLAAEKVVENLPSKEQAVEQAKNFLQKNRLMTGDMVFDDTAYFEYRKYGPKGDIMEQGQSGIKVGFRFMLDNVLIEGPGAKSSVVFGAGGEVIGLSRINRELKPLKKTKIISIHDAIGQFKKKWPAEGDEESFKQAKVRTRVTVKKIKLTYFAEPGCVPQEHLKPVYIFEGDFIVRRGEVEVGPQGQEKRRGEPFYIVVPAVGDGQE